MKGMLFIQRSSPCYYQKQSHRRPKAEAEKKQSVSTGNEGGSQFQKMNADARRRSPSGPLTGGGSTGRLASPASLIEEVNARKKSASPSLMTPRQASAAEFNTAMIHFYRGEVQRSNTWRNRLDTTTNWAVLTAGATLSFVFSTNSADTHFVIPINSILVAIFLLMEARRYRYYEIWSSRVRVLETGYLAQMLSPDGVEQDREWAEHLANDLITPHFTISEWEAIGRRLRRNYLWIFALLALSWNLKVYLHPFPAPNFEMFIYRATVGIVPGWMVFICGIIFNLAAVVFAIGTVRLRDATGEVLPRHQFSMRPLQRMSDWTRAATNISRRTTQRRAKQARQRVRTTTSTTATGEFKRLDITETPERKSKPEETVIR